MIEVPPPPPSPLPQTTDAGLIEEDKFEDRTIPPTTHTHTNKHKPTRPAHTPRPIAASAARRAGLIDEDEFEELVKSIIAQSRREAREAEQAALADLRDEQARLIGNAALIENATQNKFLARPQG